MKSISIFFLLSFISLSTWSQVRLGVRAGSHLSNLNPYTGYGVESESSTGRLAGIQAEYTEGNNSLYFGFRTGAYYFTTRYDNSNIAAYDKQNNYTGIVRDHRLNYIQVPLQGLLLLKGKKINFTWSPGIQLSFLTNNLMKVRQGAGAIVSYTDRVVAGTRGNSKVRISSGTDFGLEWKKLMLVLYLQQDILGIYRRNKGVTDGPEWRTLNAGVSLGYLIR
jgi:hypothetical protein